jgi:hypothetical protein
MSLFRRRPWSVADVPRIDLDVGTRVDIGFLGGNQHRDAFIALFEKALADNPGFARSLVVRVEAERAVSFSVASEDGSQQRLSQIDVCVFAGALYDSRNEIVFVHLVDGERQLRLGVAFDDPEFWIERGTAG